MRRDAPSASSTRAKSLRRVWLAGSLLVAGITPAAAQSALTFHTAGGDAWTFEKQIAGAVHDRACDTVQIVSPTATLHVPVEAERFLTHLKLRPGENAIRAECWRDGVARSASAEQRWQVRLSDRPKAWIESHVIDGKLVLDAAAAERAPVSGAPIVTYEWRARDQNPAPLAGLPASGERLLIPAPLSDGEYYVTLRVTDAAGQADESTAMFRVRRGMAEAVDVRRNAPAWVDHAVIYGIEPPLFGPRGLADVTARLDDLAALGVTVLWLLPITASPPRDFGYAVTDYFRVRPEFGTEADLRELVTAAHARGLRVIMDFVPNHVSDQHPYYADAAARQQRSAYFDFFARTAEGDPAHYFNWTNLKNLNYDHPEVQRLIIEAFAYWVRDFDIDGFRVDVAWGPRERHPEFWPRWRMELKRIKPDLLLLAEASARDAYYGLSGFDAAYDWTDKLGEWAWRDAFETDSDLVSRLRETLAATGGGATARVVRFLNNNDTGPRFITRHGPERTRVAAAMLLTLPGLPALYTGDAIGAAFEPYGEKRPLTWDDAYGLSGWYRRLVELRHASPALQSGDLRVLDVAPHDRLLAYVRRLPEPEENILVMLNYGAEDVRVTLPAAVGTRLEDLLHGEHIAATTPAAEISIPGHGVRILRTSDR